MVVKIYNPAWKKAWKFWNKIQPPWRPSIHDIKFWETAVVKVKKAKPDARALVIGVTPEIRDLLAKYKINTCLIDINPTMYEAMNRLMRMKNSEEKFIPGHWLDIDKIFHKNSFDLIRGDSPHCDLAF